MKNLSFIVTLLLLITSCSNGLNKPLMEPLSVDELKANMKDTTFTSFYSEAQKIGTWIILSDIRQAKYGDITYKQLWKYYNHLNDSVYFNKKEKKWKEDYEKAYKNYNREVDSIMAYWYSYKEQYNMDSIVHIEFSDLWKERYSYSYDVKNVNIGFKVTPLQGKIDQLTFEYEMKSKINNDGKISIANSHRCLASSPITSPKTLYWEADYSDERKLKDKTTEEVKRDYDFLINILNVRINGENYEEKLSIIPRYVQYEMDSEIPDLWKDEIIKNMIDSNYISYYQYINPLLEEDYKKFNQNCYDMLQEYYKKDDN